ncbi:transporter substrate-binding domain-containing protein [Sulfurimonas crateris]|uniref:Transporter substrate-binding domain-containing protein n=1 Tax=Sulfurimonas crateris TaxID=2574727 RepID=A0A4U2Z3Z3_9BACT|nr:HD domain-containing phosphohydrolase [Sulfurimonas crateris]TKI68455.1 transporter substrate-binding domain-containing protein [Sulfurimonas crateris]
MKLLFTILFFLTTITADVTKEFRVGIYDNPPKIFLDKNSKPSGFFVDVLNDIAKKESWSLNYVKCEWQECLLLLEDGKIDIMPDVAYSKEREKHFKFNKEIVLSNWSIIYGNKNSKISSILDLDKKNIAILKNSIQHEQMQEIFELFDVKPIFILTENYEESLMLTQSGKTDAAVVNRYYGELNEDRFSVKPTSVLVNPAALKFAFTRLYNNEEIITKIDLRLNDLKNNKESIYYSSMAKWLKEKERFHIPRWVYIFFAIALGALLLLGVAVAFFRYMLGLKTKEVIEESKKLQKHQEQKAKDYEKLVYAMVSMIEQRDSYTAGHSQRVAKYSLLIAKEMGCCKDSLELLFRAATLHDIGKIATPDSVLLKPDKLSRLEYDLIKEHVNVGVKILQDVPMFRDIAKIVRHHHEKYDGSGYPDGLVGDEIPKLSRIMMVADAFDAMTTNRIYKHKKSISDALKEIESLSKIHYHPEVVKSALKALSNVEISEDFNQTPVTAIEQQRFAYFYKDALTELYNIKFLETVLQNGAADQKYKKLLIISLHKFDTYNKKHGWETGNKALQEFANLLYGLFKENLLFRVRANDFLVLLQDEVTNSNGVLEKIEDFTKRAELEFDFNIYDLIDDDITSYEDLKKFL